MVALLLSPGAVVAEEYRYSIGAGIELSSGKFGSGARTNTVYAPVTLSAAPTRRFALALEIPFLYQNNGNALSHIARGGMQPGSTMMLHAGEGGMPHQHQGMSSAAQTQGSASGLGDITLKVGYLLLEEKDALPQLRATAQVKFPSADEERLLGTGEFDEGLALEISKWFGDWNPFVEAGYVVQGRSARLPLKNYLSYYAGCGYQLADNLRPVLLLKGTTAPADGVDGLLEARLKLRYQVTSRNGMEGYLAKGITSDSPDYGAGWSIYYDF
jgi:outer membrane putative beta-barrel porin/alpha-amylase